jgi:phenylalanyl-tRNA synthetase beta chain
LKFSYRWIEEMVKGLTVEAPALERLITMKTAESEGVEPVGRQFAKAKAVRVLTVEAMAKGKNKRVMIDAGDGTIHTVVCGAPNVRPELLTVWLPPGTIVEGRELGVAQFGGADGVGAVESEGMLASPAELGFSDDHSGLVELRDLKAGEPLPGLTSDWVIEIDNKSLTHRPDLWGHYGMAREVSAISGGKLIDPVDPKLLPQGAQSVKVVIEDEALCPRYSALVYESVTVEPSPLWLQFRLASLGLNPISNIVDITNFVLAELPQPMHAFDADKLKGDTIFVRLAKAGEHLKALNGETYELTSADLVIADSAGPIAIAGVIGGADSAISESTKRIVFESANFQAASVRLTSARHKIRTDASMRFEKSQDATNTTRGLARALALMRDLCPEAKIVGGVSDAGHVPSGVAPISITLDLICRKLGKTIEARRVVQIFGALGFGVESRNVGEFLIHVPSWRATKDISLKDDLVEEIGRIVGYGEITPTAPSVATVPPPSNPMLRYLRRLRLALAAQGFTEAYNYSFVNERAAARFGLEAADHLAVKSPIAAEHTHLRRSLLPGVFENIVNNSRNFHDFRLFEIGREIHPQETGGLPDEVTHLVAALYAAPGDERDFYEQKRVVECVFPKATLRASEPRVWEHPARTAEIRWRGTVIGRLLELHPSLLFHEGLAGRAVIFDVNVNLALPLAAEGVRHAPLRKYPASGFDLSVVGPMRLPVAEIESALARLGADELVDIEFVRQYAGPPLPDGQKSVSYHLEVGSPDHTLSSDEATAIRNRVIEGMKALGYELRV